MGIVYLLGDWGKEGLYKIGVTTGKIENRIKKLQTGNGSEIYLVDYYKTDYPFFVEKKLHQRFFKNNELNEWFRLTLDDTQKFKDYCRKEEEIIEIMKDNYFFAKKLKKK